MKLWKYIERKDIQIQSGEFIKRFCQLPIEQCTNVIVSTNCHYEQHNRAVNIVAAFNVPECVGQDRQRVVGSQYANIASIYSDKKRAQRKLRRLRRQESLVYYNDGGGQETARFIEGPTFDSRQHRYFFNFSCDGSISFFKECGVR